MTRVNTYGVKNIVLKVIQRSNGPMNITKAQRTVPALTPNLWMKRHIGSTVIKNVKLPQLPIIATVTEFHSGKTFAILSLIGPHVFHCRHWKSGGVWYQTILTLI